MRIIVVEDDKELRRLYGRYLADHDVVSFADAERLMVHERWRGVGVAIVDLMYRSAKVSGFDLLSWLKDHEPAVRRILVTGGYADLDRAALEGLADVVLLKPVDQAVLVGALE